MNLTLYRPFTAAQILFEQTQIDQAIPFFQQAVLLIRSNALCQWYGIRRNTTDRAETQ